MKIKPYSIKKALERTELHSDTTGRNLWIANKMLKEAIKRGSFSGEDNADIELTFYTSGTCFDDVYQIKTIIDDLSNCYEKEGYSTYIDKLTGASFEIEGYRLTVFWQRGEIKWN